MIGSSTHANNFTILRLVAASAVIFSHSYEIQLWTDVSKSATGYSFGTIGVAAFFLISGYLVYTSIVRNPDIMRYVKSRALRILPGLWAMLVVVWIVGATLSTLPPSEYFASQTGWAFVFANGLFMKGGAFLPGVFESNPLGPTVNGSLWTLKFEVLCYVGLGLLSVAGLLSNQGLRRAVLVTAVIAGTIWFVLEGFVLLEPSGGALWWLHWINMFGFCFVLGMVTAEWKISPRAWHFGTLCGVCAVLNGTFLIWPAISLATAALVFWFAFLDAAPLRKLRDIPDISYGVYIYAGPIQQALVGTMGPINPVLLAALAFAITTIPATLSWFLVERPALSLRERAIPALATGSIEPS